MTPNVAKIASSLPPIIPYDLFKGQPPGLHLNLRDAHTLVPQLLDALAHGARQGNLARPHAQDA